MARKKKEEAPAPGSPAWMATFGDLMNLLLCFFVLLFAFSSVDQAKYEELVASFSNSFSIFNGGGSGVEQGVLISSGASQLNDLDAYFNNMGKTSESEETTQKDPKKEYEEQLQKEQKEATEAIYEEVTELAEQKQITDKVSITMDSNYQYVKISISGAILFDSGKPDIKKGALPILNRIGDILKIYSKYLIKIEGHTDNVPISSGVYKSNMWLSTARATTVFEYLTNEKGLNPDTLEASGRSEFNPIASNKTPEGRAKNRRVEIKIYSDLDQVNNK